VAGGGVQSFARLIAVPLPSGVSVRGKATELESSAFECFCTLRVVPIVIFAIFARARVLEPVTVLKIPINGAPDALVKGNLGVPTELSLDLGTVERIAAVVSRAILNVLDQRLRFP
jgi:hypothetical protein